MPGRNPIESLLYDYDYDGRDNMYEYWVKNRQDFLSFIDSKKIKGKYNKKHLEAFEYKVRWASHYGLWYRLFIEIFTIKGGEFKGFDKIPLRYAGKDITINDFIDKISNYVDKCQRTDLRGLNLLDYNFNGYVIENVDFSFAALDYTTFENCVFKNCIFNNTSFYRCKIINCTFHKSCKFFNNNFNKALVSGRFDCLIDFPRIKLPNIFDRVRMLFKTDAYPLNYTKIVSQSFVENCDGREMRRRLRRIYWMVLTRK